MLILIRIPAIALIVNPAKCPKWTPVQQRRSGFAIGLRRGAALIAMWCIQQIRRLLSMDDPVEPRQERRRPYRAALA